MKYKHFISDRTLFYQIPQPLALESGEVLHNVQVAYRTWGELNAKGDNAVLICHGFTGNADADRWWDGLFGEGKTFDPTVDLIVCANILGSCYGTTGATSVNPNTGKPYRANFPPITIRDIVRSQAELMAGLGINQWKLVTGGSLGGMQTLEWSLMYPDRVQAIAPISVAGRHSAWSIALSEAQRQAIYADPHWQDGNYNDRLAPHKGLAIARMIATCSYYGHLDFDRRFGRELDDGGNFAIATYLQQEGEKLVERFDANTYISLTKAMDSHDLGRDRGDYPTVLTNIRQPTLIVSCDSDLLYFPKEQQELAKFIPNANLVYLNSIHGHDAFLIDLQNLNHLLFNFRQNF
ncbi:homoserine O-acetyltransferase [Tumidithrix elongata RA019]|uniref:Homoserine O-acetyltransferase n=1 Tax=Tumidithrix elongata BACA0141 TaxID=2716417 RepID=A0AAW9Q4C7_9CYAN|nr:homoserine O-acetyltransferase [Tumidithrix elongata RA019]